MQGAVSQRVVIWQSAWLLLQNSLRGFCFDSPVEACQRLHTASQSVTDTTLTHSDIYLFSQQMCIRDYNIHGSQNVLFSKHNQYSEGNDDSTKRNHEVLGEPNEQVTHFSFAKAMLVTDGVWWTSAQMHRHGHTCACPNIGIVYTHSNYGLCVSNQYVLVYGTLDWKVGDRGWAAPSFLTWSPRALRHIPAPLWPCISCL